MVSYETLYFVAFLASFVGGSLVWLVYHMTSTRK